MKGISSVVFMKTLPARCSARVLVRWLLLAAPQKEPPPWVG